MNEDLQKNIAVTSQQMRKGILEFAILLVISKGETYASDILKELKAAELIVLEGTLYPLLTRLKKEELLTYSWSESLNGPPRKYYTITEKGKLLIKGLEESWNQLNQSIERLIKKS